MANWFGAGTSEERTRLRGAWPEAPVENAEMLDMILDVAREQVIAYAPAPLLDPDTLQPVYPARYALAQLRQAQTLVQAGQVSTNGEIGDGAYTFTPRPMDKTIRAIITPADGKPDVG